MDLASTSQTINEANAASVSASGGLGFLDPSQSFLELSWDLVPPLQGSRQSVSDQSGHSRQDESVPSLLKIEGGSKRRRPKVEKQSSIKVDVILQQDLGMLKASKGDTGSVLWRSS